jgi:hypothetical protein
VADVDGITEERQGTISAFNGPEPLLCVFDSTKEEAGAVAKWLSDRIGSGMRAHEMSVFVRSPAQFERAALAAQMAGLQFREIANMEQVNEDVLSIMTMHMAKGLEFRAVAVMACDDEILPLQERISRVTDDSDLEEVYNTERHLLYVACTRARDFLVISGVTPASEFLDDFRGENGA